MKPNRIRTCISLFLAIVLAFCVMVPAFAEETSSGFQYIADSATKTAQITGYSGNVLTLTIPSVIEGYKVTSLKSEAFKDKNTLLAVTIPDTVTTIGSECFAGDILLGKVDLGKGVSSIGSKAFANCSVLSAITLPASTASIGSQAFSGCKALSAFNVSDTNPVYKSVSGVLFNRLGTTLIAYPAGNTTQVYNVPEIINIESYAFSGAKYLTEINMSAMTAATATIGKAAFKDCVALTKVTLPQKLAKLDDEVFSGCKKLSSLSFPATIKTIGSNTFAGCVAIPALKIPENVTTVGVGAFSGCTGIKTVTIQKGLTAISGAAFTGCTGITEFNVTESESFSANKGVLFNKSGTRLIAYPAGSSAVEYTVGDKVTTIGANAFDSCKNLKKLHIPATVKEIVEPAVKDCGSLEIYVEDASAAKSYFESHSTGYGSLKIGSEKSGDVNGDGEIDNADVILLRRYVAKWKNIIVQKQAADVNKDSEIDNADVILLRRYVAGWKNVTLK